METPDLTGIWKRWFLKRGENWSTRLKKLSGQGREPMSLFKLNLKRLKHARGNYAGLSLFIYTIQIFLAINGQY